MLSKTRFHCGAMAMAWIDISTGRFQVQPLQAGGLDSLLARLEPGEMLLPISSRPMNLAGSTWLSV